MGTSALPAVMVDRIGGLWFALRPDTSDRAVIEDNIVKRGYEKHFALEPGECWVDLGGYIGTFAARVHQVGGKVLSFEPDLLNVESYKENMRLNGFPYHLRAAAVTETGSPDGIVFYRNERAGDLSGSSTIHRWKRKRKEFRVPCLSFKEALSLAKDEMKTNTVCLKIDIEGAEMPILDTFDRRDVRKIVFEWHFAFDASLTRIRNVVARLEGLGFVVTPEFKIPKGDTWKNFRRWVMNFWAEKKG